jgi:NAD(P)-dependent dehydrogenase (short-subunit alcohol dehydrogenase family)
MLLLLDSTHIVWRQTVNNPQLSRVRNVNSDFHDRVALVTGASSGIGRATALAFARAGAKVVAADITESGGSETVELIKAGGGEAVFIKADVSKSSEVSSLIEQIVARFGKLDVAHNNAGIEGVIAATHECAEDNWDAIIDTNLKGVWLCLKYEIPQMLKQGFGAVVNTSSVAGLVGLKGCPAYAASKHGVIGLTKTAALEYAKAGIRINAVCPGLIRTPMIARQVKDDLQKETNLIGYQPLGRMGTPEEVAGAVLWLCSDAASYVTGTAVQIDGGLLAQ